MALGVFGLLLPDTGSVAAQSAPSASRSFSTTSVAAGAELTVAITIIGSYGSGGSITETLPAGFTYVSTSLEGATQVVHNDSGGVRFILFDELDFTYTVTAPDQGGDYQFSGRVDYTVGGDTTITVVPHATVTPTPEATGPSATRSLSAAEVAPGGTLEVTVQADNYGQFGGLVETLPSGFAYVSSDHPASQIRINGQKVRFTLFGESSVSYTVTAASSGGSYSFSGILRDDDEMDHVVGGDTDVSVSAPAGGPSAMRSFDPAEYVAPGGDLEVTINASSYGQFGAIVETLPSGFTYVSSSLDSTQIGFAPNGNGVRFTLFGESRFTYTATAPTTEGSYTFSGSLIDDVEQSHSMADSTIMVGTAPEESTPTPTPEPTPTVTPGETPEPTTPTRTPRPTPVPTTPPTPVAIEIVADVTEVEGATVVQPDSSAMVSSADGMATVMLPNTSRARTYQVMVSSDAAGCSGGDLAGSLQACATVAIYDAEGSMESGVSLIRRATVVMMLGADAVEEMGGLPVVFQANALGAFTVHQRDDADDSWGTRRFTMGLTEDGGIAATITSLRSLGTLALVVDEAVLEQAYNQVHGITPTPVPTPAAPTATPEPTATPVPSPTPEPPEEPPVGGTRLPVGLLVALALTGALMAYTGSRVMRSRRSAR